MWKKKFFIADENDILEGKVSDVYFERGRSILKKRNINPTVYGEVTPSSLPENWSWGIYAGVTEVVNLFVGKPVTVRSMDEGSLFYPEEPVLTIEGKYIDFGVYETAFLGFLCHSSGVATKAARCKIAAKGKPVFSFGARRIHPSVVPAVERSAFIGGCDGVAGIISAEAIDEEPVGTMAHAYIICFGDEGEAYRAFDKEMPENVKRVALIDTFKDEKFGALKAAEALGKKLFAVRLDTPGSRRGNFKKIIREVRWELDLRGFSHVKIFVSGGLDENRISELADVADVFGVGTAISNARVVDFAFDLVEREGKPSAKRGKRSGKKQVYECQKCLEHYVVPINREVKRCSSCGGNTKPLLNEYIKDGKLVRKPETPQEARKRTLSYLERLTL